MCLAIPARIVELDGAEALVEVGGAQRRCNVAFVADPKLGDYVLLHAGFAIQKWSEDDLRQYNEIMGELSALDEGGD